MIGSVIVQAAVSGVSVTDIVTATAAFLALVYVPFEIRANRRLARQTFTVQLAERDLETALNERAAELSGFLDIQDDDSSGIPEGERERLWQEWREKSRIDQNHLVAYLNHLEDVAALYAKGILDDALVIELFGGTAQRYWKSGQWLIERMRKQYRATLYERVEQLANDFEAGKERRDRWYDLHC